MGKVISIANQKGGVAKTTTAINLGIGLAREGKRTLLIDADPQGNLTTGLGWQDADELDITLANIMEMVMNDEELLPGYGILKHPEGVDLMPGNIILSGVETALANEVSRELVLRRYTDAMRDLYDYIIVDCIPSLGLLTVNALAAADTVLIPVNAAIFSTKGMEQLIMTFNKVQRRLNHGLAIEGILFTMVNGRANHVKEVMGELRRVYMDEDRARVFNTAIPYSVKAVEAASLGRSVYRHDARGKVAEAYAELTKEVLADGR